MGLGALDTYDFYRAVEGLAASRASLSRSLGGRKEAVRMAEEDSGLLATLRRVAADGGAIPHRDFQGALDREGSNVPAAEWSEVVTFASDQCARWGTQWLLSSAASSDARAREELEAWERSYTACSELLVEQFPTVREALAKAHGLRAIGPALESRVRASEGNPFRRSFLALLSKAAILLNRVGFHRIAGSLYATALFPKGTVGRSGLEQSSFRLP